MSHRDTAKDRLIVSLISIGACINVHIRSDVAISVIIRLCLLRWFAEEVAGLLGYKYDIPRSNCVDTNSMLRPFIAQRLGQLADSPLTSGIGCHADAALKRR